MIAHISIGVRDINRSRAFYDAALPPLGYKCMRAARSNVSYGYGTDSISLWVFVAERPVPADEKSGLHFCFEAPFRSMFRNPAPHIRNEQIKLTATMLNNLGTAFIIGGFITPLMQQAVTAVVPVGGLIFGGALHAIALQVLEKLDPPENVCSAQSSRSIGIGTEAKEKGRRDPALRV